MRDGRFVDDVVVVAGDASAIREATPPLFSMEGEHMSVIGIDGRYDEDIGTFHDQGIAAAMLKDTSLAAGNGLLEHCTGIY